MQLIAPENQTQQHTHEHILHSKIKRALELISTQVTLVKIEAKTSYFLVLLKDKQKNQHPLWTHWQIHIHKFVQVQVSLTDQHHKFLERDPTILIPDLITRLNRESIFGTYFNLAQSPALLSFRHSFPAELNKKFIAATISEIFLQVSQQFSKWVVKLKLLGGEQKVKSNKLFSCLKKIRYMKQYFENQRLNRSKALKIYNLKNSNIKVVEEAIRAVGYQPNLLQNYKANEVDRNQYPVYKAEYENILKQIAQKSIREVSNPIMRGIEIKKTLNEKKFDQGGYSQIFRGEYIADVTPTINSYGYIHPHPSHTLALTNQNPNNEQKMQDSEILQLQKFSRRLLVKKVMKSCVKQADSFKNQINLLIFIRSDKEERIAGYYMETNNQQQNLFMELYEHNLLMASKNWNEKQLLQATKQLIEGISYLHRKNILHRDIKELNVLIDRQNHVKLIDFGSACAVYQENPIPGSYVAINNDLLSTPNYYFPYIAIMNEYPGIKKKFTREQYNQASTFDIFSVGTVIRNLFYLNKCFDNIFYRQLTYLSDKCHEKNPQDRLTPKQAECYIYLLMQLYRLQNEQNKKTSVKSWTQSGEPIMLPQLYKQQ